LRFPWLTYLVLSDFMLALFYLRYLNTFIISITSIHDIYKAVKTTGQIVKLGYIFRVSKAFFALTFSWTMLLTAFIMPTGSWDWKMFLPISTPTAPSLIAL